MKKNLLAMVAVALLAGPMAANAVQVFDFSGTCLFECATTPSSVSGVLTLEDSYVFGTTFTNLDLVSFSYSGDFSLQFTAGDGSSLLGSGINSDGSLVNFMFLQRAGSSFFAQSPSFWQAGFGAAPNSSVDIGGAFSFTPRPTSVPEPATLALFGLGLAGLGFARRRRATI